MLPKRRAAAELARRRREGEEERQRQLRLPRQCTGCGGSGKCQSCMGRGYVGTMYLSASVSRNKNETESVCGHLPRGCEVCGGWGDTAPGASSTPARGGSAWRVAILMRRARRGDSDVSRITRTRREQHCICVRVCFCCRVTIFTYSAAFRCDAEV
eukprot:TRINITY_DN6129_c0_g2_i1.p1 TRINITY_DN6129_c0_g2~~TRINITY_DN6129_c0_g2_i1.p1  ORF type:complete len:156 (+),score=9.94 TRINITY_DN6129_c0_g2_i1:127-594(+)